MFDQSARLHRLTRPSAGLFVSLLATACLGTSNNAGLQLAGNGSAAAAATVSGSAGASAPGANGTMFTACAGAVTSDTAPTTDLNPPTWTWSRCSDGNAQYRISLDDPNTAAQSITATSFTPPSALYVGNHTLYVSQQSSDGNWSAATALTLNLLPRAQRGTTTQANPNADSSVTYAYPELGGKTVAAAMLQVSDPNGFSAADVMQGDLGDCYFDATVAAIIEVNPNWLNRDVAPLTDGYGDPVMDDQNYPLYKLTMYYPDAAGTMHTWTMVTDAKLPTINGGEAYAQPAVDGMHVNIGVPLLEKGFAALDQSENFLNVVSQGAYAGSLGYVPVGQGGWSTYAFIALTGASGQTSAMSAVSQSSLTSLVAAGDQAAAVDVNSGWVNPPATLPSGATLSLNGDIYTYTPANGGASFIVPNEHYYSFVSMASDGTVTLRNPWGGSNNGLFSMPYADVGALFNRFTAVTLPQ